MGTSAEWRERFSKFVAWKELEARCAELQRFTTEWDRPDDSVELIGNDWTRGLFDGPFYASITRVSDLPATSLVFVQSREGNTGAKNPSTLGGGEADTHLIYEGLSRVAADAVLAGAGTTRGGNVIFSTWHPEIVKLRESFGLPRHPIQIVATQRGIAFDDALIFNVPDVRVVLLTGTQWADAARHALTERPWITPVVMDHPNDLRGAFRRLGTLGVQRISCIGGRTIARHLIDAGLVEELYLTTSPRKGGEPNTPLYPKALNSRLIVRKHGTGSDTGVVFEHLQLTS